MMNRKRRDNEASRAKPRPDGNGPASPAGALRAPVPVLAPLELIAEAGDHRQPYDRNPMRLPFRLKRIGQAGVEVMEQVNAGVGSATAAPMSVEARYAAAYTMVAHPEAKAEFAQVRRLATTLDLDDACLLHGMFGFMASSLTVHAVNAGRDPRTCIPGHMADALVALGDRIDSIPRDTAVSAWLLVDPPRYFWTPTAYERYFGASVRAIEAALLSACAKAEPLGRGRTTLYDARRDLDTAARGIDTTLAALTIARPGEPDLSFTRFLVPVEIHGRVYSRPDPMLTPGWTGIMRVVHPHASSLFGLPSLPEVLQTLRGGPNGDDELAASSDTPDQAMEAAATLMRSIFALRQLLQRRLDVAQAAAKDANERSNPNAGGSND